MRGVSDAARLVIVVVRRFWHAGLAQLGFIVFGMRLLSMTSALVRRVANSWWS